MPDRVTDQKSTTGSARLMPGRVLRLYGMRRSGNHAIINWLQRNVPQGRSVFLNNCHPRRDPIASHRALDVFVAGQRATFAKTTPLQERFDAAGHAPVALISYEDTMPPASHKPFAPLFAGASETVVLIYRAFLNWSASLLRKILGNAAYGPIARARIMTAAVSGYATALERMSERKARGFVAICYDQWRADARYRVGILSALGFEAHDNTLGEVQRYGGGSSFQGQTADASELQTDQRATQMADTPEYQTLLWTAAQDSGFTARLAHHFPQDARRLRGLAETARISIHLPNEAPA